MKKLKDLKENECIKVNTLKEAKWFVKKIGFPINPREVVDCFIFTKHGFSTKYSHVWALENDNNKQELKASDFIKPKKSTKKIIKELKQEVARLDNEVLYIKSWLPDAVVNVEVERKKELEIGAWYKSLEWSRPIFCIKEITEDGYVVGYGLGYDGEWLSATTRICEKDSLLRPESHKEVEEALINYAKEQGFKKGVVIKTLVAGITTDIVNDNFIFLKDENRLLLGGISILNEGKWAEIIEQPEQEVEIDWDKDGLLVIDSYGIVCLVNNDINEGNFCGTIVSGDEKIGYKTDWSKEYFKLFKGEIILKND